MQIRQPDKWKTAKSIWSHLPRNKPAFFFAVFFVVYGFLNISPLWWLKCVFGPFGLYVEYEAQWVWGYGMALKRQKRPYFHWLLINVCYILILALPTGIGLFVTEIAVQESKTQIVEQSNTNRQNYIDNLHQQVLDKTAQVNDEFTKNHGRGPNYIALNNDLKELNDKYQTALNTPQDVTAESVKVAKKDMFTNVADLVGIPKQWIIGLMLSASLLMVYVGLWKKPMVVRLEEENNDCNSVSSKNAHTENLEVERPSELRNFVPENVIQFETRKHTPAYDYPPIPNLPAVLTKPSAIITYKTENDVKNEIIPEEIAEGQDDETKGDLCRVRILSLFQPEDIPQLLEFVERLYEGVDDSNIPDDGITLNGVKKVSLSMGITHSKGQKFNGLLNRIGAVMTDNGVPSQGFWPKQRIIDFINKNVKGDNI